MFGLEISSHFKALTALNRKTFFLFRKKTNNLNFCELFCNLLNEAKNDVLYTAALSDHCTLY